MRTSFLGVVFLISGSVIFYSHEYIMHEKIKNAFCLIVFLFVISMMFLIIRPRLVRVILGWDGLGLVSYLLVVYYQSYKSYGAGIITCLTNRIGDRALLVSIAWVLREGNLDFFYYYGNYSKEIMTGAVFIVLAAITKRAQIPFSAWLPAAMAAPTPVSALVHSSTLVTAGVYLLIRFFPLFSSSFINRILLSLGFITLLVSRLRAFYEMDLKKVIALSTLRQLGVIMVALGLKLHLLAFFHLLSHALFKASLFLRAGRIIHNYAGSQDLRHLRKVGNTIPLTRSCLVVCSLALGGIPFLSAFYSKDKIIEESVLEGGIILNSLILVSISLTIIYRFRLLYYLRVPRHRWLNWQASDSNIMTKSILILTSGGIFGGRIIIWSIFSFRYDNLLLYTKILVLIMFIGGGLAGIMVFFLHPSKTALFLGGMWVNPNYTAYYSSKNRLAYGAIIYKFWDNGWSELIGPRGLSKETMTLRKLIRNVGIYDFKVFLGFSLFLWAVAVLLF